MPDIHIHREHALGLAKARKVARQWAIDAEKKFDMECTLVEGQSSDTVEFTRAGVKGELRVEAHQFTLDAKLGFLLGAFSKRIESQIEQNLDALLSAPRTPPCGARPPGGSRKVAEPHFLESKGAAAPAKAKPAAKTTAAKAVRK